MTYQTSRPSTDRQQIIIRRSELPSLIGISLPTIDRLRARGEFVPARVLSRQSVGFFRSDVEAWLASRPIAK